MERKDERERVEWGWWEGAHTFQLLCLLQQSVSLSLLLPSMIFSLLPSHNGATITVNTLVTSTR